MLIYLIKTLSKHRVDLLQRLTKNQGYLHKRILMFMKSFHSGTQQVMDGKRVSKPLFQSQLTIKPLE